MEAEFSGPYQGSHGLPTGGDCTRRRHQEGRTGKAAPDRACPPHCRRVWGPHRCGCSVERADPEGSQPPRGESGVSVERSRFTEPWKRSSRDSCHDLRSRQTPPLSSPAVCKAPPAVGGCGDAIRQGPSRNLPPAAGGPRDANRKYRGPEVPGTGSSGDRKLPKRSERAQGLVWTHSPEDISRTA